MDVEKGCLNRCDTCLTGCDSVSYALKPTNMKASLRVVANYLFSFSGQLNRLVLSLHQDSPSLITPNYMRD
jgi:hypothetical protein